jgi:predicted MFS family arabinose efflux permease
MADGVVGVIVGRALQGAGAVSAAVTALVADSTRDSQRTKAMAFIGVSVALSFALTLVAAPWLVALAGLRGLFDLTAGLALAAAAVTVWVVPPAPRRDAPARVTPLSRLLGTPDLLRLNVGVFALHAVQIAFFMIVPAWLVERAGVPLREHATLYLVAVVGSLLLMIAPLGWGERRGRMRPVFAGAIVVLLAVLLALMTEPSGLVLLVGLMTLYLSAFNVLEASLPSLVSRMAPADARGAALGVYNTVQSIGMFVGGAAGGWLLARHGPASVLAAGALLVVVWLAAALGQKRWPSRGGAMASGPGEATQGAPLPGAQERG